MIVNLLNVCSCDFLEMRLLFVVSTEGRLRDVMGLSEAAVRRRHDVTVFFNEDSVKLLRRPSPVESLYADLLACRSSAMDYGRGKVDMVANARMSSLAELVELLEGSDRVVFLG